MPRRRTSGSRRKKSGVELLAAVLVAIGAVLCIIFGLLSIFNAPGVSQYAFGFIFQGSPVKEILAILFGVIIIAIEGFNRLYDYWSIIFIFILAIFAGTVGALLIIIGCLLAIIEKVRKE
jgi:hypothetical protein